MEVSERSQSTIPSAAGPLQQLYHDAQHKNEFKEKLELEIRLFDLEWGLLGIRLANGISIRHLGYSESTSIVYFPCLND